MFKNQLQELAQRSCFNLPSYACVREGPDHAPRFRASVNFNGEIFESPSYCTTLRQAEHAAAEVALNLLSSRGPSKSLTARVLDETGIYKNLLQETAHRAGLKLPVYTTVRSGPGHVPIFTCTVVLAGMCFNGEPAKTKKQAEKNAAIAAWSALKKMPSLDSSLSSNKEELQDQAIVAKVLSNLKPKDDIINKQNFKRKDQSQTRRKFVKGNCSYSSMKINNNSSSLEYQNWKLLDLLLDSALDGSNNKKETCFASLLPPPPPRTASKILPPLSTFNRPSLSAGGSKSSLLEEAHRKDEEEWLGLDVGNKPDLFGIKEGSSSDSRPYGNLKHNMNSVFDEKDHHPSINRFIGSNPYAKSSYMPRNMHTGVGSKLSLLEAHRKDEEEWLGLDVGKTLKEDSSSDSRQFGLKQHNMFNSVFDEKEQLSSIGSNPIALKEGSSSDSRPFGMKHNTNSVFDENDHQHSSINRLIGSSSYSNPYAKSSYMPRNMYTGGFSTPQRIAPAVQIRSVIPVCAAPPTRPPNPQPINQASSTTSSPATSGFPHSTTTTAASIEAKVSSELCSELNKLEL
ncbi:hypothetical protein ACFE04_010125 [Oxalis oulophora]